MDKRAKKMYAPMTAFFKSFYVTKTAHLDESITEAQPSLPFELIGSEPQHLTSLKISSIPLFVGSVEQQHKSNIAPAQTNRIPANNAQQWLLRERYKARLTDRARFKLT
jgi:hypothetical protein